MRGVSFSCNDRHNWQRTHLLQAGNHLVVTARIDIYNAFYQSRLKFLTALVCADIEAGSDYPHLIHLRMYVNGNFLFLATSKQASPSNSTLRSLRPKLEAYVNVDLAFSHTRVPSASVIWARCPAGTVMVWGCAPLLYIYSVVIQQADTAMMIAAAMRAVQRNRGMRCAVLFLQSCLVENRDTSNSMRSFRKASRFSSEASTQFSICFSSSMEVVPLNTCVVIPASS